jgi:sugar phosphate isomerase/epimerase
MSRPHTKPISPLRQLANIISESVEQIDAAMEKTNLEYPSLDVPFNPFSPAEAASMSHEVRAAAALAIAACGQLSAIVNIPAVTLYTTVGGVCQRLTVNHY